MWRVIVRDQETSKTRRLEPATGLWKIHPQWAVMPRKQTNNKHMFYMHLSESPGFSYFETKNVKIINNFLIPGTQLSLYKSACIYGLFLNAVIIRREQIKDDVMGGVSRPAWWKRKMHTGFW
jgi:hypothetical protein